MKPTSANNFTIEALEKELTAHFHGALKMRIDKEDFMLLNNLPKCVNYFINFVMEEDNTFTPYCNFTW